MIIERTLTPYIVFGDEPVLAALQKITANRERIVFCVDHHGALTGSLSDGDFRRWLLADPTAPLDSPASAAANTEVRAFPVDAPAAELAAQFSASRGISHLPLVEARGRLVAIAIDRADVLRIGEHRIGPDEPTFVIAEIGNNHQGDPDLARRLVDLAVEAGADAVKFQLRDMDALYRQAGARTAGEDMGAQYTLDLLSRFSLGAEELLPVLAHARGAGVAVMCTPWDLPSAQVLADDGIDGLKIASADLTNHDLIADAGGRGIPLVLSTGMSREEEIVETVGLLQRIGASYALLHCQSTYPAPFKDVHLNYLDRLAELGDCIVGYSGHERGWHVPVAAVARGARIVEKHFTVDRSLEGNDHTVSLLPDEFRTMVEQIRDVEAALGSAAPRVVSTGEAMNRITLAKSLVSTRDLAPGEVIADADVDVRSPGRGLQPNRRGELVGRTVHRPIAAGEFFFAGDLAESVPTARQFEFDRPWGIPVRYHDWKPLVQDCTPDFLEFHFSYKDLDVDLDDYFTDADAQRGMGFTTHLPDLFAGDFLVNFASFDDEAWERSIRETQRSIDATRALKRWFPSEESPIMVATLGGFTRDRHVPAAERPAMYARIAEGLARLDTEGIRLAAQTLPPFPWLMGGQQHHNLFLDPRDTAQFADDHGVDLCLDISHTALAANFIGMPLSEAVELLAPRSIHLHLVDATGVDGEGVQVGEGEIDWPQLCAQLERLAPGAPFIPEIWQGHINSGEGFWVALDRLERWFAEARQ